MKPRMEKVFDEIVAALAEQEWAVCPAFLPAEDVEALIEEERQLWEEGQFRQAGVGVGPHRVVRPEIRSDRVLWLEEEHLTPAVARYWQRIEALRRRLNEEFFLGLRDFEAHFAVYPPGAYYRRHLDQFREVRQRFISCILYLNKEWDAGAGGQLRIYRPGETGETYVDVVPYAGTFVCFRSDTVEHEVLPATRSRFSLTGWLRRAT